MRFTFLETDCMMLPDRYENAVLVTVCEPHDAVSADDDGEPDD